MLAICVNLIIAIRNSLGFLCWLINSTAHRAWLFICTCLVVVDLCSSTVCTSHGGGGTSSGYHSTLQRHTAAELGGFVIEYLIGSKHLVDHSSQHEIHANVDLTRQSAGAPHNEPC